VWKLVAETDSEAEMANCREIMKTRNAFFRTSVLVLRLAVLAAFVAAGHAFAQAPKVLLLLHGMNSSPSTWNDFVASQFGNSNNKGIIRGGTLITAKPTPNSGGVYCYAVEFGAYDRDPVLGRAGLEGTTAATSKLPSAGDFSDFATLGREVEEAIKCVTNSLPGAQVTLLAHSRGGVAARAYLQNPTPNSPKENVLSLLTTGTPHKGSHLGRIYDYLAANPRAVAKNDWTIVDKLISEFAFDVRRPVIDDMADYGPAIPALNAQVASMPSALACGNLRYTVTDLGYLGRRWGISYSVFLGINIPFFIYIPPLSSAGKTYVLGAGKTPSNYKGDGIVEADSQNLLNLAGRPAFSKTYDMSFTRSVYHTEETATGQTADMVNGLKSLTTWWK
jgi:triacylglycerol esterase/lipase EstA (alpha/beta hydrolase family)